MYKHVHVVKKKNKKKKKKRDPGVHMWTCTTHMCTVPHVCTHAVATVRTNIMV